MSRPLIVLATGVIVSIAAVIGWRAAESSHDERVFEAKTRPSQAAPMCPWREPQSDLEFFFPSGAEYHLETHILSGFRTELAQRLGRPPTGDDNLLQTYRVSKGKEFLGTVLTRRVKGTCGAIEVVLAVDASQCVCGLRLQRQREPEPVARVLQDPKWAKWFEGKTADSSWGSSESSVSVPMEGLASAEAIAQGARELLVLLAVAEQASANTSRRDVRQIQADSHGPISQHSVATHPH